MDSNSKSNFSNDWEFRNIVVITFGGIGLSSLFILYMALGESNCPVKVQLKSHLQISHFKIALKPSANNDTNYL